MSQPEPWIVSAHNTATQSQNKIHDDDIARRYGFRGGLVPGVDDYAYMAHVPTQLWGLAWIGRGTMSAHFHQPVYDGQLVEVRSGDIVAAAGGETIILELLGPDGTVCATGDATLPAEPVGDPPHREAEAIDALPDTPPPASPESLAPGTAFGLPLRTIDAEVHAKYLADIRETLPLFAAEGVAHPGALLRLANRVFAGNVTLGPWIHVSSEVRHHGLVHLGDRVGGRAVVTAEWEHKGHRFVTLDVELLVADDATERTVATIEHTAIHTPRS
ncbi:MAG: hypothetical protein JJE52_10485 [Acidimicrobiia bacterium]|nr:hypothetical protein [Acidimicrobiia bacterium]